MSFGTQARRVRDERLSTAVRYGALRCAVERYCPLGFTATWAYITGHEGIRREDAAGLLRALDRLEVSRESWLREVAAYAQRRRAEKRLGFLPRRDEWRYRFGFRWPGPDAHEATLFTVSALWEEHRRSRLPSTLPGDRTAWSALAAGAAECVESYLAVPDRPYVEDHQLLWLCTRDVQRLQPWNLLDYPGGYEYCRRLIKLTELVAHDVLPLIRRGGVDDVIDPRHDAWVAEINGHVVGMVDGPDRR